MWLVRILLRLLPWPQMRSSELNDVANVINTLGILNTLMKAFLPFRRLSGQLNPEGIEGSFCLGKFLYASIGYWTSKYLLNLNLKQYATTLIRLQLQKWKNLVQLVQIGTDTSLRNTFWKKSLWVQNPYHLLLAKTFWAQTGQLTD